MRYGTLLALLLFLSLLPLSAYGDTLDHFSVVASDLDIEFSLPASVTVPDALISNQYATPVVPGSLNGAPSSVGALLIFPGTCAVCDTIFLNVTSDAPGSSAATSYEFGLPNFYSLTFPTQNSVTLSFLPGTYPSEYIIDPPYDILPATITVTAEATATTPEPPSLVLLTLALLLSLGTTRHGFRRSFFLRR